MTKVVPHKWEFKVRFRKSAFGWKSQPAILRVKQAVSEIQKVAKNDPILGAEGAVLFFQRLSPALEQVDSSSGAMGTAVYNAISELVPIIAGAPADAVTRNDWLERLWQACQDDDIPYIESLDDHWGDLCVSSETAGLWADRLLDIVKLSWSPDRSIRGYCQGITHCLSALLAAGRHEELLSLVKSAPYRFWHYRKFGVLALAAMGRVDESLHYAESEKGINDQSFEIAQTCEHVLISAGRTEEAYRKYGQAANEKTTHLATFRAIAKKYPHVSRLNILEDLIKNSPGDEGKWFTAAKDAGLLDLALFLATHRRCDPMTLSRAARDYADSAPDFAVGVGFAALRLLSDGGGYDITGTDVRQAYEFTVKAADKAGRLEEVMGNIRGLVLSIQGRHNIVGLTLGRELGLPPKGS